MAPLGRRKALRRQEFSKLLPRLYKFALVLTAHEQLGRALVRATCRSLPDRSLQSHEEHELYLESLRRMHGLWAAKLAEAPNLRQSCPPEPRLFASAQSQVQGLSNVHLAKFIANMPAQQRAALYLVYGEGASYDEAAEVLDVDILSLMKHLSRGHAALAHWLEHRGIDAGREAELAAGLNRGGEQHHFVGWAA